MKFGNEFWLILFWEYIIPKLFAVCRKFKAEFRSMERSVERMKLHREKYSGDFIPYNQPELFQGCEKLEKFTILGVPTGTTETHFFYDHTHVKIQGFTKLSMTYQNMPPLNGLTNYQEYFT